MKIIADENIPFVNEAFSTLGEVSILSGRKIDPEAVGSADVLLVRSITNNPLANRASWLPGVLFFGGLAAIASGIFVGILADNSPKSHLVLSDAARKARDIEMRKRTWTWGYLVASAASTTAGGVLSRYIFAAFF